MCRIEGGQAHAGHGGGSFRLRFTDEVGRSMRFPCRARPKGAGVATGHDTGSPGSSERRSACRGEYNDCRAAGRRGGGNVISGDTAMKKLVAMALVLGLVGAAAADDKAKADPTGTWKWTVEFGGQQREQTLKLKLEGDKLTGSMVGRNQETPIEDARYKDGEVSFKVT